jgi:hypothetical protein
VKAKTRRRVRRSVTILAMAMAAALSPRSTRAQASVTLGLPTVHDSLGAAPLITATVTGVPAEQQPVTVELEVSINPTYSAPLFVGQLSGLSVNFLLPRPLPAQTIIYFRVTVFNFNGVQQAQGFASAITRSWLNLVSPQGPTNVVVYSTQPQFVWSSSPVTSPPGPWLYDLTVTNTATQQADLFVPGISDTAYIPTVPLQANTSYHWSLVARLANDPLDQATAASISSFVVSSPNAPLVTLLYQNFPNPFPQPSSQSTCLWFDLAHQSQVQLNIYSLRGLRVKTIVPGPLGSVLPVGAYGRLNAGNQTGCDPRLSWDGTDQRGHVVPKGVYYARFQADGVDQIVKIVFNGR